MPLLDTPVPTRRTLRPRSRVTRLLVTLLAVPSVLSAQLYPSHTDDASAVPQGMLRVRVTTIWSRFDERFTATGRRTLGDEISSEAFGTTELPLLRPAEAALRTLSNDQTTRLSFGRLAAESDARIVRTPIALEYGLTRRLTVGFSVPIVQTRRSIALRVNPDSNGTVGFVPERLRQTAAAANNAVYAGFVKAADSIGSLISKCPATPTAPACAAVLANVADATATRQAAQQFADAVKTALGTEPSTALIAPSKAGTLAARIETQRTALNTTVQKYLGSGAGAPSAVFTAPSAFSYIDLQGRNGIPGLLQSNIGGGLDSIQTTNRLALGGITVGAQFLVLDNFARDTMPRDGLQARVAVGAAYRFEPAFPDSARRLGVIPVADGSAIELRSAMDVVMSRFGATIAARYAKAFAQSVNGALAGDPEAFFPVPVFGTVERTTGAVLGLDLTPRLLLGDWFAIDGHYGFERTGATTYDRSPPANCTVCASLPAFVPRTEARTAQRAGFGVRYSTVDSYARGAARMPIEVSFTHIETISGDAGVARLRREQLQLRVFLRVRRVD